MADHLDPTTTDQVTVQELAEVIAELEEYRERLLNETLTTAQRAKLPKTKAIAQLEPQLTQIDAKLQELREQLVALKTIN